MWYSCVKSSFHIGDPHTHWLLQIEELVEQQSHFQKQLIEKEEEVGKILQEMDNMDELKAENNQLKVDNASDGI